VPIVGDWDGNGTATIGVFRPEEGKFYLRNANSPGDPDHAITMGRAGDVPLAGDWDGDGTSTIGAFRPADATFYLRGSHGAEVVNGAKATFGLASDLPVVGNWDAK
jgi:hypothetical protein